MSKSTVRSQQKKCEANFISILVAVTLISHINLNYILECKTVEAFTLSTFHCIGRSGSGNVEGRNIMNKISRSTGGYNMSPGDLDSQNQRSNSGNSSSEDSTLKGDDTHHDFGDVTRPDVEVKSAEVETTTTGQGYGGSSTKSLVCEKKLVYDGAGALGDIMSCPTEENDAEKGGDRLQILDPTDASKTSSTGSIFMADDTKSSSLINYVKPMQNGMSTTSVGSSTKSVCDESSQDISLFLKQVLKPNQKLIKSGLVTSAGGTLQSQFGHRIPNLSPLDRIALTANGNMQRIVSSFYDAPVHVYVERCKQRDTTSDAVWDRTVHLSVLNQMFCRATSVITVHSSECVELVQSEVVGIGQLFRHLDKLPTFALLDAGRTPEGGLWRSYQLQCQQLTCNIREELSANVWEISPTRLDELDNTF